MPSNKLLRAKQTASSDSASSAAEIDTEQVNEINKKYATTNTGHHCQFSRYRLN